MNPVPPFSVYILGALAILLLRRDRLSNWIALLTGAAGFALTLLLPEGEGVTIEFLPGIPSMLFHADGLALFAGRVFALAGLIALLYACSSNDRMQHAWALIYTGCALGVVYAGDYLLLYIFWEAMALASLALIWRGTRMETGAAGYRYILMHAAGGALLLGGIVVEYTSTGSLSIISPSSTIASALILAGIGVNAAFIPLHTWLPDAYPQASVYGTVFLSIFTTKTAIYLLARVFAGMEALLVMGALMALYGAIFALMQNDIRKLLCYSIMSQLGYMVSAVGAGGAAGVAAGMAHAASDLLFKSLLLMGAGAFILASGKETLQEMRGIGRRDLPTSALFSIGALCLAGVPLLSGSVTKGFVLEAVHEHGVEPLWALLVIASIITVLYTLRLLWWIFATPECNERVRSPHPDVPLSMRMAMAIHASLCLSIGLLPAPFMAALPGDVHYEPFGLPHIAESLAVIAIAGILFYSARRLLLDVRAPHCDLDAAYIYAGRVFVSFCTVSLAGGAAAMERAFHRYMIDRVAWFARNPVRAIRILGYTILASVARIFMPAEMADRYEEDLERCRKGYPGDPARIWGTGYGILLVSLLFLIYLIFLFVRG